MVKQGDILKVNLNPVRGHEQAGYRPVIVVSGNQFNSISNDMVLVCPISNTKHYFPLHIPLDERTLTTGVIITDQIKALDLTVRKYSYIESAPQDITDKTVNMIKQIVGEN